nr:magnesium chelatase domain-containing protein [Wolbachia endosymbiont of Brugia pahangi]
MLYPKRVTVNLSYVDLLKEGSHYNLTIAVRLLVIMYIIPVEEIQSYIIMGELAFNGKGILVSRVLLVVINAREK